MKEQLEVLQRQLELLELEKKEVEGRLEQAEKKNEELESRGGWRRRRTDLYTHRMSRGVCVWVEEQEQTYTHTSMK